MAGEIVVGIRLSSDGKSLVTDIRSTREEHDKLVGAIQRANTALGQEAQAQDKVAQATGRATAAARDQHQELRQGATALDVMAKRYQIVAEAGRELTRVAFGSYIVMQAKQAIEEIVRAQIEVEKLRAGMLNANFGDQRAAAKEIDYVRQTAKQYGQELNVMSDGYRKLSASARGTVLEGRQVKEIFEAITIAATAHNLSAQETQGVILAVGQMMSKGNVQAEELRGQLGERLPGAFGIAAKAMGVTTGEMNKMLEDGKVLATDFLPKFAAALKSDLGEAALRGADQTQAATNRAASAWQKLKQDVAETGLGEFWKGQIQILTDAMDDMSNSIERARKEGAGFLGQTGAALGAAGRFANPINALSYQQQETNYRDAARLQELALQRQIEANKLAPVGLEWLDKEIERLQKKLALVNEIADREKRDQRGSESTGNETTSDAYYERVKQKGKDFEKWLAEHGSKLDRHKAELKKFRDDYFGFLSAEDYKKGEAAISQKYTQPQDDKVGKMVEQSRKALAVATAEAANSTDALTAAERALLQVMQDDDFKKAPKRKQDEIKANYELAAATERRGKMENDMRKGLVQGERAVVEAYDRARQAVDDHIGSLVKGNKVMEFEITLLGRSAKERELAISSREKDQLMMKAQTDGQRMVIESIFAERDALIQRKYARQEELAIWSDWADKGGNAFADFATSGKDAFQSLENSAKSFLREMLALFAKKFVLNVGANMTGNAGMAAQAASAGQGTAAGSAVNWASSASGLTGFGQGVSMGWQSGVAAPGAIGESIGAWASSAAESLTTVLAYIPVWGWIAAAVVAIAAWVSGNRSGGPKTGGSSVGRFDAQGNYLGAGTVPGSDNGRFYTPNQGDEAMDKAVQSGIARGFFTILSRLGGSVDSATFGLGFDKDPEGSAGARLSSLTEINGRAVRTVQDRGVDQDDPQFQQEVALEIQRMILAGLQASNLSEEIAGILRTVSADTGTIEEIARVIETAEQARNMFRGLDDAIAAASSTPLELFQRQLDGMSQRVREASMAFDAALKGTDPAEAIKAGQTLGQALIESFEAAMQIAEQLSTAISQLGQQAYEFSLGIAQRRANAGGTPDISGLSLNRAQSLRGGVGGNVNPARQLGDVGNFLGAIDTWYEAEKQRIMAALQQQQQAAQAQAAAQQAIHQARISSLNAELQILQQWGPILDQVKSMQDSMRFTGANPLSVYGRLGLATGDVNAQMAGFRDLTGQGKADAASRLLPLLQTRLGLLQEGHQRPSGEYEQGYNEIAAMLAEVGAFAQTQEEKALALQNQIIALQGQGNGYAASTAGFSEANNAELQALNLRYMEQLDFAEREGARLYELQDKAYRDQLNALTGGVDVQIWQLQRQQQLVDELKGLRSDFKDVFGGGKGTNTTATVPGGQTGNTGATGTTGTGNTGAGDVIVEQLNVTSNNGRVEPQQLLESLRMVAPSARRILIPS